MSATHLIFRNASDIALGGAPLSPLETRVLHRGDFESALVDVLLRPIADPEEAAVEIKLRLGEGFLSSAGASVQGWKVICGFHDQDGRWQWVESQPTVAARWKRRSRSPSRRATSPPSCHTIKVSRSASTTRTEFPQSGSGSRSVRCPGSPAVRALPPRSARARVANTVWPIPSSVDHELKDSAHPRQVEHELCVSRMSRPSRDIYRIGRRS